jgi:hypothetical protein
MPKSEKFKKLLASTRKFYGKQKGTSVAYALAHKYKWKA